MSDAAIRVEGVSKRFQMNRNRAGFLKELFIAREEADVSDFWALRDVSFEVPEGSMYGVIGHNGSGKSTLMRMMANIYKPTEGRIWTRGRVSALLELGTGFHQQLSGRENIFLNASILGIGRREIEGKLDEIIDFAGIGRFIDSPVKVYSSGMKVRLGFSVAVHVDPEILLLDEVVAVGDERFKRRCFEHIYDLRKSGVTIVLVTHSLGQVQSLCDRALWLDQGEVREDGDAIEVARSYLQQVNLAEAEADLDGVVDEDTASVGSHEGRGERKGTGEITIEGVEFLNAHNKVTPFSNSGRPLVVRINYRAHERVDNPSFALRFHNDSGTMVTAPNSRRARFDPGIVEGDGVVSYAIPRMHLTPGTYHLTVGVFDEHNLHVYDERVREFELKVQPGAAPDTDGYLDIGGEWRTPRPGGGAADADG